MTVASTVRIECPSVMYSQVLKYELNDTSNFFFFNRSYACLINVFHSYIFNSFFICGLFLRVFIFMQFFLRILFKLILFTRFLIMRNTSIA